MQTKKSNWLKRLLRHTTRLLVGVAILAATTLVMAWWIGMFSEKISPSQRDVATSVLDPGRDFGTDEVHVIEKQVIEEAVGTLRASSRTEVSARILAAVKQVNVRAGDVVAKGDVLVQLDRQAVQTQLNQAQAALDAAKTAVAQAKDSYDRGLRLRQTNPGALSEQMFNDLLYKLESAKANQIGAEQALAEAEVNRSYTTIEAPKAGKIIETYAEEGDMARPGEPLLALYDPNSLRLEVPVMENVAIKLRLGDELNVSIDALNTTVRATVDEIVPQAEAASRSLLVKVSLPQSPELFEGLYGRLEIPAGVRRHLCLATAAVETVGQLEFVYVVRPDGTNEKRFVKTGRLGMPGRIEVLSGVEGGEKVLLVRSPVDAEEDS